VIWAPVGVNLATTLIPLPSLVMWPVTALLGPLPAYDILSVLSPAVAATAMYALCRGLTGRDSASLLGGWLYGFSTYELSPVVGHANLMLIAVLPLAVLVVVLRAQERLGRGRFIAFMTFLFLIQLFTSSEVLASSCAFGALALVVSWLAAGPRRAPHARANRDRELRRRGPGRRAGQPVSL
jgi:hypothetical protein